MLDLKKLADIADLLTPEEMPTLTRLVMTRYNRQLNVDDKLKPQQVLACPKCGRKRTIKIQHGTAFEFAKVCGNPNCRFIGYISNTNSKRGGRIVTAWNKAVRDYLNKTYEQPVIDNNWNIIE